MTEAALTERAVRIARLGRRGDGVDDSGLVFVARCLPGETVEGRAEPEAGGALRLAAPRILSPSPDRVAAPCSAFGRCGGCALMHASDAFVAGWKRDRIAEALAARGLSTELRETATSPPASRRRAALSGRRTKSGATVGFHARRGELIVDAAPCRVLVPQIVAAREALAEAAALAGSRKGETRFAVTATEAGLDVDLAGAKPLDGAARARLAALAGAAGWARLTLEGEPLAADRPPVLRFGRARVALPPAGFAQATEAGEAALVAAVREATAGARRVADLFAGAGTFSLPLAETAQVHAVEGDAAHLQALAAGWRGAAGALRQVTTEARDLFRRPLAAEELAGVDAVAFDPPRAGARAQAAALAASDVPRLAAVSCNPETFARDARVLVDGGYALLWALPVDQFRWSPHVELAAAFARR